jgi:hypothetical protein
MSGEDDLLHALAGESHREREAEMARLDERWDRLAAGDLAPAEEAELRALAGQSAAARQAYEAFRPLGADFRQRVVQAVQAQAQDEAGAPPALPPPPAASPEPAPAGRILPFNRLLVRLGGALAAAAALAAAVALVIGTRATTELPGYGPVELTASAASQRGGPVAAAAVPPDAAPYLLHQDDRLTLRARPLTAVAGPIEARWFVVRQGVVRQGAAPRLLLGGTQEVSSSGVVQLKGRLRQDLGLSPGLWVVWAMVGRPRQLPDASILLSPGAGARWTVRGKDWIVWRVAALRIESGASEMRRPILCLSGLSSCEEDSCT